MSDSPDFEHMTGDEITRWIKSTDDQSALLRWMRETGSTNSDAEEPPTRLIAVRVPVAMIERLDALTAGSKEGRSGLVRLGIQEVLNKIDEAHRTAA